MDGTVHRGVIVVGVDGSAGADSALRHALEEADRRGAVVRAVTAVRPPEMYAFDGYLPPELDDGRAVASAAADVRRRIADERERSGATAGADAVAIVGSPVPVLLEAARDAELLVVGHRGRGPWRSALLGSVSLGAVLHAPCPVTVVRVPEPAAERADRAITDPATPLPVGPIA